MYRTSQVRWAAAFVVSIASVCIAPAIAAGDEPADPLDWAPENTLAYAGTSDCNRLADSFKKIAIYRALTDPKLEGLASEYSKIADAILKVIADALGLDNTEQLKVYPQGPAGVFITIAPPPGEDEDPEFGLVAAMDMGDNAEKARTLISKVTSAALEHGARKETEEVLSVKIVTLHLPEKDDEQPSGRNDELAEAVENLDLDPMQEMVVTEMLSDLPEIEQVSFCMDDSRLIVGSSAEDVSQTLRCMKGRTRKTLARSPAGKLLDRKHPRGNTVRMLVNVPLFFELAEKHEPDAGKDIRAWGLDGLGAAVGALEFAPEADIDSRMTGFWAVSPDKQGVPAILRMKNQPVAPPTTVAADAAVYGTLHLSPKTLLKEIFEGISRSDPEAGDEMKAGMIVPMSDGTALDIQTEILDHLSGPFSGQLVLAKPYDADNVGLNISLGHQNRQAMEKLFTLPMVAPYLEKRDLLGHSVYSPMMFPMAGVSLAVTETTLAVGTTKQLERSLRAEGKSGPSLADDATFKRLARAMPREAWFTLYGDSAKIYDAQLAIHRAGDTTEEPQFPYAASLAQLIRFGLGQGFEGQDLKHPEAMRDYNGVTLMTVSTEADGLSMQIVSTVTPSAR